MVDGEGDPVAGVCVVIGPHGCQSVSPHTDQHGVYFFDVPQVPTVVYDLYFTKEGYATVWRRVQPTQPTVLDVVLHRGQG